MRRKLGRRMVSATLLIMLGWKANSKNCGRFRVKTSLHFEQMKLSHLDLLNEELEVLETKNLITNNTLSSLRLDLRLLSHGWCSLKGDDVPVKRSIGLFATILLVGQLILGPLFEAILNHPTATNDQSKWYEYLNRVGELGKKNNQFLKHVELRINNLEMRMQADQEITGILSLMVAENNLYRDIIANNERSSFIKRKFFSHALKEYARLNLTVEDDSDTFPLNEGVYSIKIRVKKSADFSCSKTHVIIIATSAIPSEDCLEIVEHSTEHALLRYDNSTCITTGPVSTKLNDNSTFFTSNALLGPCSKRGFDKVYKEGSLLLRPQRKGSGRVKCGNNKEHTYILYRDTAYGAPTSCQALFSERKIWRNDTDYSQFPEHIVDRLGHDLEPARELTGRDQTLLLRPFWAHGTPGQVSSSTTGYPDVAPTPKVRSLDAQLTRTSLALWAVCLVALLVLGILFVQRRLSKRSGGDDRMREEVSMEDTADHPSPMAVMEGRWSPLASLRRIRPLSMRSVGDLEDLYSTMSVAEEPDMAECTSDRTYSTATWTKLQSGLD